MNSVQEITKTRSTRAPFLRLSETTGDNGMKFQIQKKHCKYSAFRGFSWSVIVYENGAEERT